MLKYNNENPPLNIHNNELTISIEQLILSCFEQLHGEYKLYSFYQKDNQLYGLIHAEYYESNDITLESMKAISLQDGKYLHAQLKNSGLHLDYFFILPYFNYKERKKSCILFDALITNNLN
jgi:hypothetical protein